MLLRNLPDARVAMSAGMRRCTEENLSWEQWLKPEAAQEIRRFLDTEPEKSLMRDAYDILLLADTHLEQQENSSLAIREAERGALILLTGRLKKGCCTERLAVPGRESPYHGLSPPSKQNGFGGNGKTEYIFRDPSLP